MPSPSGSIPPRLTPILEKWILLKELDHHDSVAPLAPIHRRIQPPSRSWILITKPRGTIPHPLIIHICSRVVFAWFSIFFPIPGQLERLTLRMSRSGDQNEPAAHRQALSQPWGVE